MSDGGEGLLDAVGGTKHVTTVAGPLGAPVEAEWRMLEGAGASRGPDRRRRDVAGRRAGSPPEAAR